MSGPISAARRSSNSGLTSERRKAPEIIAFSRNVLTTMRPGSLGSALNSVPSGVATALAWCFAVAASGRSAWLCFRIASMSRSRSAT